LEQSDHRTYSICWFLVFQHAFFVFSFFFFFFLFFGFLFLIGYSFIIGTCFSGRGFAEKGHIREHFLFVLTLDLLE